MSETGKDPWSTQKLLAEILIEYPEVETEVRRYLWSIYIRETGKQGRIVIEPQSVDQNGNLKPAAAPIEFFSKYDEAP